MEAICEELLAWDISPLILLKSRISFILSSRWRNEEKEHDWMRWFWLCRQSSHYGSSHVGLFTFAPFIYKGGGGKVRGRPCKNVLHVQDCAEVGSWTSLLSDLHLCALFLSAHFFVHTSSLLASELEKSTQRNKSTVRQAGAIYRVLRNEWKCSPIHS